LNAQITILIALLHICYGLVNYIFHKKVYTTNIGEDVGKNTITHTNTHILLVGMKIYTNTMENTMEAPQKSKNRTAI
jgi:hypothetical protein